MKFVVLGSPDSWYFRDLARAAGDRHEVVGAAWRELNSSIDAESIAVSAGQRALAACDAVLVRTMPAGSLEQIIFRMDALGRLEAGGVRVLNPARAVEAAIDKYLALARLQAVGLPVPRTIVCQTVDDAMAGFERLGRDIVVKPLFGSEGRGLVRLRDEGLAERTFQLLSQLGAVLYLQEFIAHPGHDLRVLILGRQALGMRRSNASDWRTNISRGARAEALELSDDVVELARRAADAIGAPLAGVDLLPGPDGRLYVIEVNAVPGWKGLARVTGIDVAKRVLELCANCESGANALD